MISLKNEKKEATISFTKIDEIIIGILRVFYRQVHLFLTLKQRNYLHSFFYSYRGTYEE